MREVREKEERRDKTPDRAEDTHPGEPRAARFSPPYCIPRDRASSEARRWCLYTCDLLPHKGQVEHPIQEAAKFWGIPGGGAPWDQKVPGMIAVAMEPCQIHFLPSRLRRKDTETGIQPISWSFHAPRRGNRNKVEACRHGVELLVALFHCSNRVPAVSRCTSSSSMYTYITLVPLTIQRGAKWQRRVLAMSGDAGQGTVPYQVSGLVQSIALDKRPCVP